MQNATTNRRFLHAVTARVANQILDSIAAHYGVSRQEIYEEVTGEGAEHLLEYMVEPHRSATHVLMQRHGLLWWAQDPADPSRSEKIKQMDEVVDAITTLRS